MKHILFFLILIISTGTAISQSQQVGIVEHLDEYIPEDINLVNVDGETVNLKSLIDKPTVICFVYYRCPGICTPLMDGVVEVINGSDMTFGEDYQVLSISFDYTEGYDLALKKRNNYSMLVKKEGIEKGWQFFTADSLNVAKVTNAVGFQYKKTGSDFLHTAGLVMVSPEGKITRYLNGTYFLPFEFKLAVIEASKGIPGPTVNRIYQFCYSYDPVGQTYVLNVTKVAGSVILFFGILVFIALTVKPKSKVKSKQL